MKTIENLEKTLENDEVNDIGRCWRAAVTPPDGQTQLAHNPCAACGHSNALGRWEKAPGLARPPPLAPQASWEKRYRLSMKKKHHKKTKLYQMIYIFGILEGFGAEGAKKNDI